MRKEDIGRALIGASKRIKIIKNAARKVRQEYNNHYFKSIIGNREIGGLRAELHGYENDDDISLAKSCSSLDEWRQNFVENCIEENRNPADCVRQLDIGNYIRPPCSYPECSRLYHRVGGDSLFLVFHYKSRLKELETLLKEEQTKYASALGMILQ